MIETELIIYGQMMSKTLITIAGLYCISWVVIEITKANSHNGVCKK